jgi:hypothetical protein
MILRQLNAMYGPGVNKTVWAPLDVAAFVLIVLGVMAICSGLYHLWQGKSARRPVASGASSIQVAGPGRHWRGPFITAARICRSLAAACRLFIPVARERSG